MARIPQITRYLPGFGKNTASTRSCKNSGVGLRLLARSSGCRLGSCPPAYAVNRIVDQYHRRRWSWSCCRSRWCLIYIDVLRSSLIVANDGLVKPTNDKVYRPTCLYFDFVGKQLVFVTVDHWRGKGGTYPAVLFLAEPPVGQWRLPCAKADGGVGLVVFICQCQ